MGYFETFSKRQKKRERAGQPDVYQYDDLPQLFRVQVIHIWQTITYRLDAGSPSYAGMIDPPSASLWRQVVDVLARELGVFELSRARTAFGQVRDYMLEAEADVGLDLIEVAFRMIDAPEFRRYFQQQVFDYDLDDAIGELNHRFREHSLGYQFTEGQVIRVDSQFIHAEVVTPAITLLHDLGFSGPADEFLRAHEHYRHNRNKEAMNDALKAFESTMKAICEARQWPYDKTAPAKKLIDTTFDQGLIPQDLVSYFGGFRSALESGLPTVRNKMSGHGQGATPVAIPDHVAAFALHLAASNIVFLVEAHKAKP